MGSLNRKKKLALRFGALGALLAGLIGGAIALVACSNQGEGERCDHNAPSGGTGTGGNDDCQDGLQCTLSTDLGTNSDICCPPDRTQATTAICAIKHSPPGGDAAPPAGDSGADDGSSSDTGAPDSAQNDSAAADSGTDSATDAGTDSATDAGTDSATDAGSD